MKSRDERIEARYHLSARDLAERLVDAEDEAGRLRTQVKVAEAKVAAVKPYVDGVNARIEMLENVVDAYDGIHGERDRYRLAWSSARHRAGRAYGAWRHASESERAAHKEMIRQDDFARTLWGWLTERRKERDRYRLAWLSARRRAAEEAALGAQAVDELRDARSSSA
ncbi:hypothetical protein ACFV5M_01770 [Streptomyces albidoflavus]